MKSQLYRERLRGLKKWDSFLLENSGLPGPRGNIELALAVAEEGDERLFLRLVSYGPEQAPTGTAEEFLAFCGTVGLGTLLAQGDDRFLTILRQQASDPRWRIREGVAMALQRLGDADMDRLIDRMRGWAGGSPLEMRAAAAAVCEPRLLVRREHALQVLRLLDRITASMIKVGDRKTDGFQALRKGLGYCWSVAVAALPDEGKAKMERWLEVDDRDVIWVMKENLRKNRLARLDPDWVRQWRRRMGI
jgi:hypothetical protein